MTPSTIKALSLEERRELAAEYLADGGKGGTYNLETATFKNVIERTHFIGVRIACSLRCRCL